LLEPSYDPINDFLIVAATVVKTGRVDQGEDTSFVHKVVRGHLGSCCTILLSAMFLVVRTILTGTKVVSNLNSFILREVSDVAAFPDPVGPMTAMTTILEVLHKVSDKAAWTHDSDDNHL
jgi:hypothetical protein